MKLMSEEAEGRTEQYGNAGWGRNRFLGGAAFSCTFIYLTILWDLCIRILQSSFITVITQKLFAEIESIELIDRLIIHNISQSITYRIIKSRITSESSINREFLPLDESSKHSSVESETQKREKKNVKYNEKGKNTVNPLMFLDSI